MSADALIPLRHVALQSRKNQVHLYLSLQAAGAPGPPPPPPAQEWGAAAHSITSRSLRKWGQDDLFQSPQE